VPVSGTALLLIDVINDLAFDGSDVLVAQAEPMALRLSALKRRATAAGIPAIYVNDNFGQWRSNRDELLANALEGEYGRLVEPIKPDDDSIFVVKARHSIFYQTPLEYLLNQEDAGTLILVGQVTEQCILYSALDAYIRHFKVRVPRDAVAHIHADLADAALRMMDLNMGVDVSPVRDRG
jgi:nicotinamidase-related amidase